MFTLYGAPGWGSAISELMFSLCGEPYRRLESQLGDSAFLLGDNITLLDACLPVLVRWRCAAAAVSPAAIASSPACCPAQSRR